MKTISELINLLKENNNELIPVTKEEYHKIMKDFDFPFPKVYEDFLLTMGKSAGGFMRGSSVFIDELSELQEWAKELLEENCLDKLPDNAFVFWMHQGYQMAYFILGESDNPPVYYFSEGLGMKKFKKEESLMKFFETQYKLTV